MWASKNSCPAACLSPPDVLIRRFTIPRERSQAAPGFAPIESASSRCHRFGRSVGRERQVPARHGPGPGLCLERHHLSQPGRPWRLLRVGDPAVQYHDLHGPTDPQRAAAFAQFEREVTGERRYQGRLDTQPLGLPRRNLGKDRENAVRLGSASRLQRSGHRAAAGAKRTDDNLRSKITGAPREPFFCTWPRQTFDGTSGGADQPFLNTFVRASLMHAIAGLEILR
jgi:hypothetical protein